MARVFELPILLDYVSDWGIVEAVREFFQNCIDEETQNPSHKWWSSYDEVNKELTVANRGCALDTASLLLGKTSKAGDNSTIGSHGEGYKVASVVLLRTGHTLKIFNGYKQELWTSKVIKSRRYGADIVGFNIQGYSYGDDSLRFVIGGITPDEYEEIQSKNLWICEDVGKVLKSEVGSVLLNEKFSGQIFVKGLYVKTIDDIQYGYNFEPSEVRLDRDRRTLDSWDLQYTISKLVSKLDARDINEIKEAPEIRHLNLYLHTLGFNQKFQDVANDSYKKFKEKYGEKVIPVENDEDFNKYVSYGYECRKLEHDEYSLITSAEEYEEVEVEEEEEDIGKVVDEIVDWFDSYEYELCDDTAEKFRNLLERLKKAVKKYE